MPWTQARFQCDGCHRKDQQIAQRREDGQGYCARCKYRSAHDYPLTGPIPADVRRPTRRGEAIENQRHYAQPVPTAIPPGSDRVAVLAERVRLKQELFSAEDFRWENDW